MTRRTPWLCAGLLGAIACNGDQDAPGPFLDTVGTGESGVSGTGDSAEPPSPPDDDDDHGGIRLDVTVPDPPPEDGPPPFEGYGALGQLMVWMGGEGGWATEPQSHVVGHDPESLALADVDGDGDLDVIVSIPGDASVVTLVGGGDGGFQTTIVEPVGERTQLRVVDLDGDGFPERVALGARWVQLGYGYDGWYKGQTLRMAQGLPGGGFEPEREILGDLGTLDAIMISDLDGDTRPDLYVEEAFTGVGCYWNRAWSILQGNDAGEWMEVESAVHALGPRLTPLDFNVDGYIDVLGITGQSDLFVSENDHSGTFTAKRHLPLIGWAHASLAADVVADESVDLVLGIDCPCGALDAEWALQIHPGLADRFAAPEYVPVPTMPRRIVASRPAIGTRTRILVAGELEEGSTPIATDDGRVVQVPGHVRALASADLDHDGHLDALALVVPPSASPDPDFHAHRGHPPVHPCPE